MTGQTGRQGGDQRSPVSGIHIFYGFAKRRCPERPKCMYCNKRRTWVAFTYFGAPVCRECWDGIWRKGEDGECDPPFDAITNEATGEWLVASDTAADAASEIVRPEPSRPSGSET